MKIDSPIQQNFAKTFAKTLQNPQRQKVIVKTRTLYTVDSILRIVK